MITPRELLTWMTAQQPAMLDYLAALVRIETPSREPETVPPAFEVLGQSLVELGFAWHHQPGTHTAGFLVAPREVPEGPYQLVIGHMDTVWPTGTLAEMPLETRDGRLAGPGSFDMKAGLTMLVFALRALQEHDVALPVAPVVFVNADEEIGSFESTEGLTALAKHARRAFVLEPSLGPTGRRNKGLLPIGGPSVDPTRRDGGADPRETSGVEAAMRRSLGPLILTCACVVRTDVPVVDSGPGTLALPLFVTAELRPQALHLRWEVVGDLTHHRVLERAGAGQPLVERMRLDPGEAEVELALSILGELDHVFHVEACVDQHCRASQPVRIRDLDAAPAVGILEVTQPESRFLGEAVALSANGTRLVVGAPEGPLHKKPLDPGEVVVFERAAAGAWVQQGRILAPVPTPLGQFGTSVAIDDVGTTLAVQAVSDDGDWGAAHVYRLVDGQWTHDLRVHEPTKSSSSNDYRVVLSGDGRTLAVPLGADGGSVLVYRRDETGWTAQTVELGFDRWDHQGLVALDATGTLLVAVSHSGRVATFARVSGGSWTDAGPVELPELGPYGGTTSVSLSGAGDQLAIGIRANGEEGTVYVVERGPDGWSVPVAVAPPSRVGDAHFGAAIALSQDGRTLAVTEPSSRRSGPVVGLPGTDPLYDRSVGAVWVFTRDETGWGHPTFVRSPRAEPGDRFGASIDVTADGRMLAVGVPLEMNLDARPRDRTSITGAAFVY